MLQSLDGRDGVVAFTIINTTVFLATNDLAAVRDALSRSARPHVHVHPRPHPRQREPERNRRYEVAGDDGGFDPGPCQP